MYFPDAPCMPTPLVSKTHENNDYIDCENLLEPRFVKLSLYPYLQATEADKEALQMSASLSMHSIA